MSRRIMVEVSEEELKALDKTKTLDDIVEELINYFDTHNCVKSISNYDKFSGDGVIMKLYETPNRNVDFKLYSNGEIYIKLERKPNNRKGVENE